MSGWSDYEHWRNKTKGAKQIVMGHSVLISIVTSSGRPWSLDEYIGAMRREYRHAGVDCPVDICRGYVKEVVDSAYIR